MTTPHTEETRPSRTFPPDGPKRAVADLLNELAGGEIRFLSIDQYRANRSRIDEAVAAMRREYEGRTDDPDRQEYYRACWVALDRATKLPDSTDQEKDERDQRIVTELAYLRSSIKFE